MFAGLSVIRYDDDRVESLRIESVLLESSRCEIALQRGEAEAVVFVMPEDELYETVAEAADAVVKKNRIGCGGHACV